MSARLGVSVLAGQDLLTINRQRFGLLSGGNPGGLQRIGEALARVVDVPLSRGVLGVRFVNWALRLLFHLGLGEIHAGPGRLDVRAKRLALGIRERLTTEDVRAGTPLVLRSLPRSDDLLRRETEGREEGSEGRRCPP